MLRREGHVLEAGEFGESGPLFRLVALRVEGAGQDAEETIDVVRRGADERVRDHAAQRSIYAPVDEQTQAAIAKKFDGGGIIGPAGSLIRRGINVLLSRQRQCKEECGRLEEGHGLLDQRIKRSDGLIPLAKPPNLNGSGWYSPTRSTFVLAGILSSIPSAQ